MYLSSCGKFIEKNLSCRNFGCIFSHNNFCLVLYLYKYKHGYRKLHINTIAKLNSCCEFTIILGTFGVFGRLHGVNKYDNYTLVQITPRNDDQLKLLKTIIVDTGTGEVDILKASHGLNDAIDVLVSPRIWMQLNNIAKNRGLAIKSIHNYGRLFDEEELISRYSNVSKPSVFNYFKYNSYRDIQRNLINLARKSPHLVRLEAIGTSYERRLMRLIKISSNHEDKNPIIFLDGGTHAREWASIAMAVYIIRRLAFGAPELGGVDWYILPVVNPDGYEFTRAHPNHRMWRKTRSKTWRKGCLGVDTNRNYAYMWGHAGASFDPCDFQIYAGPRAFSERETRIVRRIMWRYSDRIKLYASIHTYGQFVVYPWWYTAEQAPEADKLRKLAGLFSEAIEKAGGAPFQSMSGGQWYPGSGTSDDFALGRVKIPYAYTLEITDGHQFVFPDKLLRTVLPQLYEGFKALANEIKKEFSQ